MLHQKTKQAMLRANLGLQKRMFLAIKKIGLGVAELEYFDVGGVIDLIIEYIEAKFRARERIDPSGF